MAQNPSPETTEEMALKSRFRSTKKPSQTKPKAPAQAASPQNRMLRLVQPSEPTGPQSRMARPAPTAQATAAPVTQTVVQAADQNEFNKKLVVYHRINELYQEPGRDLNHFMKGFLQTLASALDAEIGALWIKVPGKNEIKCQAALETKSAGLVGKTLPVGSSLAGTVFSSNKALIVYDAKTDGRFATLPERDADFAPRSLIASPLHYGGEVIGAIEILRAEPHVAPFKDSDLAFLEDACTPAAMHIKTSLALDQQNALLKRMHTFSHLHEVFSSTMELDKLLEIVLTQAIELLDAEVGSLWLVEDHGEKIECKIASGPTKDKVIGLVLKKGVGIIGWVIDRQEPLIVEDCSKDSRFFAAVDEKIQFVTRSLISAPLCVKGEAIGALQVINKKGEGVLFNQEDLELLMLFASSSAMYVKNARLFAAEKKADELSALIKVSKEITSTLDLDSVLMSIVNLSSKVISYDQAAISIEARGGAQKYEVRGLSGSAQIDRESERVQKLTLLHNRIATHGKEITLNSRDEYLAQPDALPELKDYLVANGLESFWAYVLQDDQGALGVFSMESTRKTMLPESKRELLSILVSQSTVALRNASLYSTIPSAQLFQRPGEQIRDLIRQVRAWPRQKQKKWALGAAAGLLSLILIRVPYLVSANIEIVPVTSTYYSQSKGLVQKILVREGQRVQAGELLARIDIQDLLIEQKQKESQRQRAISEMIRLQAEDRIAEYKIKENEKLSLDQELELLNQQVQNAELRAKEPGIVVSSKLDELVGMPVNTGQELVKIARNDQVFVQFQVTQDEVHYVKPGQKLKFKVFGHPNQSFSTGLTLRSVAGEGRSLAESDPTKYFIATAAVPLQGDEAQILRPGMTGRGKIYAGTQSLIYLILGGPLRQLALRLFF